MDVRFLTSSKMMDSDDFVILMWTAVIIALSAALLWTQQNKIGSNHPSVHGQLCPTCVTSLTEIGVTKLRLIYRVVVNRNQRIYQEQEGSQTLRVLWQMLYNLLNLPDSRPELVGVIEAYKIVPLKRPEIDEDRQIRRLRFLDVDLNQYWNSRKELYKKTNTLRLKYFPTPKTGRN